MKPVILCEGKRDVKLIECYYEHIPGEFEVKSFIGEEVPHSKLTNRESELIRDFPDRWNPYDVLVKSENGITNLQKVFGKLAKFLFDQHIQLCLMVDLDGGEYDEFLAELTEHIQSRQGPSFEVVRKKRVQRNATLLATRNQLHNDGATYGSFDVIAFHSRLETALDIDKRKDSRTVQHKILREFVTDDRAKPIHRVL